MADPKVTTRLEFIIEEQNILSQVRAIGNAIGRELGRAITKAAGEDGSFAKSLKEQAAELKKVSSSVVDTSKVRQQLQQATRAVEQYNVALRNAQVAQQRAFATQGRATEAEAAARAARDAAKAELDWAKAQQSLASSQVGSLELRQQTLQATERLAKAESELAATEQRTAAANEQVAAAAERVALQELKIAQAAGEATQAQARYAESIAQHNSALADNIAASERSAAAIGEFRKEAQSAAGTAKAVGDSIREIGAAEKAAAADADRAAAALERLGKALRAAEISESRGQARVSRAEAYELEARASLEATQNELKLAKALEQGAASAKEAAEARLRVAQISQQLVANEADVERASIQTSAARHELAQAEERSARIRSEMAQISGGVAAAETELSAAIEKTNAAAAERVATAERAGAALGGYRQRVAEAAAETKAASSSLSSMGQAASSVIGHVTSLASAFLAYHGIVGIIDAIVTTIRAASAAGREYESAFIGVAKTTEGVFDSMGRLTTLGAALQDQFRQLSREIPLSISELFKLGELGGQFDVPARDIAAFSETVGRLVSATNLQSEGAAESLAQLRNVLSLTSEELDRFAAALVYTGNNSATTETEILALSRRLAGAAATYDIQSSALLGIAAAMKSVGVETEAGSTQVQKFFNTVNAAVLSGNDTLLVFAQTAGLTVEEFTKLFEEDAAQALVLFVEGLGRSGRDAIAILNEVGLGNERAIRTFLPLANAEGLLAEQIAGANEAFRENTALLEESELRYETAEAKIQLLKNAWTDLLTSLSNAPAAGGFAAWLGDRLNHMNDAILLGRQLRDVLAEIGATQGGDASQNAAVTALFENLPGADDAERLRGLTILLDVLNSGMAATEEEAGKMAAAIAQSTGSVAEAEAEFYKLKLATSFVNSGFVETEELAQKLAAAIADGSIKVEQLPPALQKVVETVGQGKIVTDELSEAFLGVKGSAEALGSATGALTDEELALLGITQEVAQATSGLTAEQEAQEAAVAALVPAYADAVQEMLKGADAAHEWVAAFIEQAAEAGATQAQLEEVLRTTGALSEEQLTAASNTALFAAEQARLLALVGAGEMTYGAAAAALAVYADELGIAASQAAAFGEAQAAAIGSSFVSGLESSFGGGGGGGGSRDKVPSVLALLKDLRKEAQSAAKDIQKAAKDAGRDLTELEKQTIDAAEAMKELDNELLDAAEGAGATNREILDLAVALGELSPEDAAKALAQLARGEGIKAIAKAYVEGRISAEQAKEAVTQLNQQVAEGANIDLSNYGIQIRDVADAAAQGASGAGGAAKKASDEFRNWRLELLKTAEANGAPLSTLVKLARATGEFSEETILSNARVAAMSGTMDVLGGALKDLPLEEVVGMLDQFDSAIKNIDNADTLAEAIGVITTGAGGIDTLQEQLDFLRIVASGISIPVAVELVQTGAGHDLSELITDFAGGSGLDIEVAARIILDIVDTLGTNDADLIAYVTRTAEDIVANNDGITIETAIKLLLNLDESEARRVAGQYSEEEIQKFFPSETEIEMGVTVRTKLRVAEGGNQAQADNALELAILGRKQFGERAAEVLVGVDGDAADLVKAIDAVTESAEAYITPVSGDTDQLVEDIQSVTEDAEYETTVRADTNELASEIQGALDAGDFKVKVNVEVDASEVGSAVDSAAGAATAPTSRSRQSGDGGGVPKFAEGGPVSGPSHASGGVLAELEGGEYVIPKDKITPQVRSVLDDIRNNAAISYSPGLTGNKIELQPQNGVGSSKSRTSIGSAAVSPGLTGGDIALQPQTAVALPNVSSLLNAVAQQGVAPVPPSRSNNTTLNNYYDMSRHTTYVNLTTNERGSVLPLREIGAYTR